MVSYSDHKRNVINKVPEIQGYLWNPSMDSIVILSTPKKGDNSKKIN